MKELSIIVPVFNEENSIEKFIIEVERIYQLNVIMKLFFVWIHQLMIQKMF